MNIKIGNRDDSRGVFLVLKRGQLILSVVGLLTSCFAAAWGGVQFSAKAIVPKIVRAEMAPEIRQLSAQESAIAQLAVDMDRKIREGDRTTVENVQTSVAMLQTNMAVLSVQITEAIRVEHELLLRLDGKR